MKKHIFVCAASVFLAATGLFAEITQNQMVDTSIGIIKALKADKTANLDFKYLKNAKAIAVIPNTTKSAFLLSAHVGKGIFSMKTRDGSWSPPVFINFKGFGAGLQAGYSSTDLILFFMTNKSFDGIFDGKCTIDTTADVSLGKGYKSAVLTDVPELSSHVIAFGKSSGLFMGASLENSTINIDDRNTNDYYERLYKYEDILNGSPKESVHTADLKAYLAENF